MARNLPSLSYRRNCNKLNSVFGNAREWYVRWLAKVGAAASGLARFTIGARVSEPGVEVYAGEPLAPSDKTYYHARIACARGRLPLFRGSFRRMSHLPAFRPRFPFFSPSFSLKRAPAEMRSRSKVAIDSRTGACLSGDLLHFDRFECHPLNIWTMKEVELSLKFWKARNLEMRTRSLECAKYRN